MTADEAFELIEDMAINLSNGVWAKKENPNYGAWRAYLATMGVPREGSIHSAAEVRDLVLAEKISAAEAVAMFKLLFA